GHQVVAVIHTPVTAAKAAAGRMRSVHMFGGAGSSSVDGFAGGMLIPS
ncbi:MAG: hypothetical protein RIS21_599, partial [Planctomycetota bacterium]